MKQLIIFITLLLPVEWLYAQQTLSLQECRDMAIQNNKELQITDTKIKAAQNDRKEAFTAYFPNISATGVYLWNQNNIKLVDFDHFGAVGEIIPQNIKDFFTLDIHNIYIGSVSLVQPVFTGGKIITYNQIARYAEDVARSLNDVSLQNVIYLTDQAYWQVVSLENKKKLADAYVDLLQQMYNNVQAMIDEGVATQADGLSVRVKLNEAEVAQTKAENGLALSRMLLNKIIGLPLETKTHLADENIDELSVPASTVQADVNTAFANRGELKSLELATRIYKKRENLVLADLLPNVGLTANYMVTNPNGHNGFKNEFAGGFNVGVLVKVPITDWWGGTYKKNSARAETHIKKLELEEARELIELEVHQSVYQVNEANKRLIASQRNMENAEENLDHATYGFEEGVIALINVMEAQTAWVSAQSEWIDSQIEVKLTEVYLTKALGILTPETKK